MTARNNAQQQTHLEELEVVGERLGERDVARLERQERAAARRLRHLQLVARVGRVARVVYLRDERVGEQPVGHRDAILL